VIRVSTPTLTKGTHWYNVPPVRPHFTVEVKEDVPVDACVARNRSIPLAARDLTAWLQAFFAREVEQIASA